MHEDERYTYIFIYDIQIQIGSILYTPHPMTAIRVWYVPYGSPGHVSKKLSTLYRRIARIGPWQDRTRSDRMLGGYIQYLYVRGVSGVSISCTAHRSRRASRRVDSIKALSHGTARRATPLARVRTHHDARDG